MIKVKNDIYWVGVVDWDIKNFHGYLTHRGSSYNAYLIVSDKIALVDTVKSPFYEDMLRNIKELIDPSKIDYIILNHAEPDHSGSIKKIANKAPKAKIISSERGRPTLNRYYQELDITTIKEYPTLDLGKKTLSFVPIPMAHWPDSMVTYITEDKVLLSNDAFGQHIASSSRFDDEIDNSILWQEATSYYANILMPLNRSVNRAINALEGIEIDMIAPSHGVIWRKNIEGILEAYNKWVNGETEKKAIIVYDSMWHSTEIIARAIANGIISEGVIVKVMNLTSSHRSDVITEILDAKAVLVGSPTLNNHVFPTVAGFLAYMRGLKPLNKIGAAFGSYGWAGGAKSFIEEQMKLAGIELIESDIDFIYKPSEREITKSFDYGKRIAKKIKES
jgi:flavorubredoxin